VKAALLLLFSTLWVLPQPAAAQQPANPAQEATPEFSLRMSAGADDLISRKFMQAATDFEGAAQLDPQSAQAQFWAGQALVYAERPGEAIHYLERARTMGTDSVALHLALVAAYAGSLQVEKRDAERTLLHGWHSGGDHATLAHAQGFLLETIFSHPWHINVMEYFEPQSEPNLVWRFTVRDPADIIEATYVVREDSPESKTKGFVLLRYGGEPGQPADISGGTSGEGEGAQRVKTYDTLPTYDVVRVDVLQRVRSLQVLTKNEHHEPAKAGK
jgi:hypothetical protein